MDQLDRTDALEPAAASSSLSKWVRRGVRARWVLLGCYVALSAGWYVVFLSRWDPLGLSSENAWSPGAFLICTLVLFGVQWLLLLGAPQLSWPRPRRRRSIFASLAAGSAIAVLLSAGIVGAVASLYKLIHDPGSFGISGSYATMTNVTTAPAAAPPPKPPPFNWRTDVPWTPISVGLVAWTFWFLVFALAGGGEWTGRFRRMYRALIAGTVLELLITIPIDVQVRRRTSCYCGEGTFFALAIGLTAIVWTFGPGVAIVFLARRRERRVASGCCLFCGYNLRGLQSPRCPECGKVIERKQAAPA